MSDTTLTDTNSALGEGEQWIEVFKKRGVWTLTKELVDRWVARNRVFFGMIERHVPHGANMLEIGCGPGRHALGASTLGYTVTGIDFSPAIVAQARANAEALGLSSRTRFMKGDMFNLSAVAPADTFRAVTHGGVMEHFESADAIRASLRAQLEFSPAIVFDIPFNSPKNLRLFSRDDIFRQLWTAEQWVNDVLDGLPVAQAEVDLHDEDNMTDDLVVAIARPK